MKKSSAFKTSPRLRGCDEGEPAQPEKSGERTSTGSPLPASSPDKASELSAQGVKQSASLINGAMVAHNFRQLTIIRHVSAVVAGSAAGIFGLEGLAGLLVFFVTTLCGGALMLCETGLRCNAYFTNIKDVFFSQFFTATLTFVLVWTLIYNVVYIF